MTIPKNSTLSHEHAKKIRRAQQHVERKARNYHPGENDYRWKC